MLVSLCVAATADNSFGGSFFFSAHLLTFFLKGRSQATFLCAARRDPRVSLRVFVFLLLLRPPLTFVSFFFSLGAVAGDYPCAARCDPC
jgi:hypothetical protein